MQMNERIKELALDAGLLNYVDNETPRRYFIDGHADLEEVEKFAKLIVREFAGIYDKIDNGNLHMGTDNYLVALQKHFGVE
jgi:hypothetical protein